ncbi:MAG: leucine-rich repeat domain-containing protein [Oscillospiraceae bacterium]|nr:leucine-rich repeat domain-containing protein [Oscillospiraceae bacterium]
MKKLSTILTTAVILLCLTTGCGNNKVKETDFEYKFVEDLDGIEITEYNGNAKSLKIPAEIDGKPVVRITGLCSKNDGSEQITEITIPDSVHEFVAMSAPTENLAVVNVDENNPYFTSVDGVLFSKDLTEIVLYPTAKKGGTYDIPDTVTTVGEYAFGMSKYLTSMTVPDKVKNIKKGAFTYCSELTDFTFPSGITEISDLVLSICDKLTSVKIPDGVTSIGVGAFTGCGSLAEIDIPESVTRIGGAAFSCIVGNGSLTKVTIPKNVEVIGYNDNIEDYEPFAANVFRGQNNLLEIKVDKMNEFYSSSDGGVLFDKEQTVLLFCPPNKDFCIVPESVTVIDKNAFWDSQIEYIIFASYELTTIGEMAFYKTALTSITLPDSVTFIGKDAFKSDSLEYIMYKGIKYDTDDQNDMGYLLEAVSGE